MSVKNSYPELKEVAYQKTSCSMQLIVNAANELKTGKYPKEVCRMAYVIFRNESGNGTSGVNNNYIGCQADVGRWSGLSMVNVVGTCTRVDNAGDLRRFIAFNDKGAISCFEFLCYKVFERQMYIGANGVNTTEDLYNVYQSKWVSNPKENTPEAKKDFISLYGSAIENIQ